MLRFVTNWCGSDPLVAPVLGVATSSNVYHFIHAAPVWHLACSSLLQETRVHLAPILHHI